MAGPELHGMLQLLFERAVTPDSAHHSWCSPPPPTSVLALSFAVLLSHFGFKTQSTPDLSAVQTPINYLVD